MAEILPGTLSPSNVVIPPSYLIFQRGGIIFAKNGLTGLMDFQGADASTVINNVIGALPVGGSIYIKAGTYNLTSAILINKNIDVYCDSTTIFSASAGMTTVVSIIVGGNGGRFVLGTILGNSVAGIKGVLLQNTNLCKLDITSIQTCAIGLDLNATDNNNCSDNVISFVSINGNGGIGMRLISGGAASGSMEGNDITFNFINNSLHGIEIATSVGVIAENVINGNSIDNLGVASAFGIFFNGATSSPNVFLIRGFLGGNAAFDIGGSAAGSFASINNNTFEVAIVDVNSVRVSGVANNINNYRDWQDGHAGSVFAMVTVAGEGGFNGGVPLFGTRMFLSGLVPILGINGSQSFFFYSTLIDGFDGFKITLVDDGGFPFTVSGFLTGTAREGKIVVRSPIATAQTTIKIMVELSS